MLDLIQIRPADGGMLLVALLVAWSFYNAHRGASSFNLFDLLMEHGRVSRIACLIMGAFGVLSWIMIRLTLDGKVTEGYFTAYGALFVAPIIARMFAPAKEERKD